MATLANLKHALVLCANTTTTSSSTPSSPRIPLTESQYATSFSAFTQGPGWATYRDFIIPELSYLLAPLHESHALISVLEIGPGPKSVLGYLPESLRGTIEKYTAFEPNGLFAEKLKEWLGGYGNMGGDLKAPFASLEGDAIIHQMPFGLDEDMASGSGIKKYDIVLFCHSMYGMKPQHKFIQQAIKMLVDGGVVAVFHRDGSLHIDGLACHHLASYPTGLVGVADNDDALDHFSSFVAGFTMQNAEEDKAVRAMWRKICHDLARREDAYPKTLLFAAPEVMMTFNHNADTVSELHVFPRFSEKKFKNKEASSQVAASIVHPVTVWQVQACVQWAHEHRFGLTVVGGGHSAHCSRSNVVAVDMSYFDSMYTIIRKELQEEYGQGSSSLVVIGAGCKTGDIISKTLGEGLTVPLGSRPSVGAGLWLQGGIGHLTRLHGLTCDAIIGAVMVSVASAKIIYVGYVPSEDRPIGASRAEKEDEILWALNGAGTNFGIVISVTFKAYPAPTYITRNWALPLDDNADAKRRLREFDDVVAKGCEDNCSADAYLYWDDGRLNLGITTFETTTSSTTPTTPRTKPEGDIWGAESNFETLNGVEAFEAEMYMSVMHGGHGGGKTSSFKRCVFLKGIGGPRIAHRLIAAVECRPSPFCYLHLLHGGGKASYVAPDETAFGCRDWDFACVITGVWPRDKDGTQVAHASVQWVYEVVENLLPLSNGTYGADLGPDPRDAALADKAFGPNTVRLGRLKRVMDPHNVLAWTCPLPKPPLPKLIILVTGEHGAGKDYCAGVWVSVFSKPLPTADPLWHMRCAQSVRISDATKREFATSTGANFSRLLEDRTYKEQHRSDLTTFYKEQVRQRPRLPEEHFLKVVHDAAAADVDVLFITGMRDEAPVASFSHLVPCSKVIEVHVETSDASRVAREVSVEKKAAATALRHCPNLTFGNDTPGNKMIRKFAETYILHFVHNNLQQLADMVRSVPDFPKPGIQFRHVLGISQQSGGLALCASLLQSHFSGSWTEIDAIVCCEVGGLVFAPALASQIGVPLVPIREAGKLPPPTISVTKGASYISSSTPNHSKVEKRIEIEQGAIIGCESVVVVDDVLSTGETLCAVLHLLEEAGVENIMVMVVAEFPLHRGRKLLYERGFGMVNVQSLLVFGGN